MFIEFFYIKVQAIYINIKDKNVKSRYIEETTNMTKENMQPRNYVEDERGLIEEQIWQIEIPKIELVAPISEGTSQEVMLEYVGHFENTSALSGNVGLAAHNRGYPINYFAKLKELEINDEIIYKTQYGIKRYKVILTTIIQDTDWSYLQETEENKIETASDLDAIAFMGTNVISGSAKGVVVLTSDDTYFGKVAKTLTTGKPKTAFQKGIENISKLLIKCMLVLIPIVFLLTVSKHDIVTSFTFAVAIAICITPLLLPVILSSTLSKGALRMSKKKTIVKKLDSIQSFGAMNILCTDKTGTLTEDKIVLEKYLDIMGNENIRVLEQAFLNSYFQTGLRSNIDEAVINRGIENEIDELSTKYKLVDEIPFDFSRRRLSVIVNDGTQTQLITKGAVEEILSISTQVSYQGKVSPITNEIKNNIKSIAKELNKQGLRVIAVCQKNNLDKSTGFNVSDEKNMILIGFIGFLDPPKESAKSSIEMLYKNGIRVVVLTGDNVEVTKCVCDKVGIKSKDIITGIQLDRLPDIAVKRIVKRNNIFAKLSPIQKARIVRLLKDSGNVVGYMGDGINDSPSLVNSDVGVSVDTAVDIAKESADIILLEKDLHVLLDGVKEGRHTFANLMKYIKLAASFNFASESTIQGLFPPSSNVTGVKCCAAFCITNFPTLTLPVKNI